MTDPTLALTTRVQQALAEAFGPQWREVDPVIRPANKRQTDADFQANAAMALAKRVGKPPREIAQAIADQIGADDGLIASVEIAGPGFLNLTLRTDWLAAAATHQLADDRLGIPTPEHETVVVDYSSVNAAKEMHVAHLRSAVVGDSLVRTLEALGHDVIRQNHLGDWGTAFGMLIEHLLEVGEGSDEAKLLESDPNAFYRAARAKFDSSDKAEPAGSAGDFAVRARQRVATLQSGDPDSLRLWSEIMDLSKVYLNKVYTELGVLLTDDDIRGESSYNDELAEVCDTLEAQGIAVVSAGALCIFQDEFIGRDDKPVPLIIRKSDGGYGYATTDLATIRHRSLDLHADRALYVVGAPQNLHFRMVWSAADKAGWVKGTEPIHVQIGNVVGTDGKILRTRSGDLIALQFLVDSALERAAQVVAESRPDLSDEERATIAHQVGIGSIKYADLSVSHDSGYTFDLDRMLALQGNTGPYLQYATARIRSILSRADAVAFDGPIVLSEPDERALALRLSDFGPVVADVGESLEPHRLAAYLYELASTFTAFYEHCPVLKAEDPAIRDSRLALCALTRKVLVKGLDLLGIQAPDQM
ncbi:arginine--tRNA ligase [Flexivirga endophytica]|uniref:Arginine--tRNA ligase n=1 Tax=Flexivirga endophytica TaxID=1849103 RepID=A0A916T469_9MICO|nr:arginine--tRNA ligase [Flexivirga endophytica]GGB30657.1 arginine--tRNA ligase [Flexivirga endophytica]GHB51576.1 arginine--tRNA ligase [Flexivirga endophytica]